MKYKNAPIQEAVFDVRIDKIGAQSVEDLKKYKEHLPKEYQNERRKNNFSGFFQVTDDKEFERKTKSDLTGYIYATPQNDKQIQATISAIILQENNKTCSVCYSTRTSTKMSCAAYNAVSPRLMPSLPTLNCFPAEYKHPAAKQVSGLYERSEDFDT